MWIIKVLRISLVEFPSVPIVGGIVNDLVHPLAELLEHTTGNSPDPSTVAIISRLYDDDLLLRIENEGPVIDAQHVASLNTRLAVPETVTVQDFAQTGLATGGVLAKQIGAVVELGDIQTGGISAIQKRHNRPSKLAADTVVALHR